ncbi:MAG: Zn-dependent alcohol dehydrogenase [Acidimicrobiales bacterium]|nr:Zn-dependent alcohol dehydrogenase [Acidimicrobiales bacterium]MDG2217791.1 Zn-dependent alcohol dehydrogenase [Acidimicrobiales bacterium]
MVKAAVCREFGAPLVVEEIEVSPPGPGEVRVTVKACAICHSDIMLGEGSWGGVLPGVYGHEAAGEIESVGEGVDTVVVGDRVVISLIRSCGQCHACVSGIHPSCTGEFGIDSSAPLCGQEGEAITHGLGTATFAEQAVVDASQVVKLPDDIPWASASMLGCGVITGFGAVVNTAKIEAGSHVAVIGCGGVGINSLQGAALAGARTVIAIDLEADKRDGAFEFGATHAVDPTAPDAVDDVKALTDGRGVDYAFVTVGAKPAIESAQWFVAAGGAVVIAGMTASGVNPEIDTTMIADSSQRILGSKMGSGRLAIDIPNLVDLYAQGRLKLDELVSDTYSLDEINEAIASTKAGSARRNVIIF